MPRDCIGLPALFKNTCQTFQDSRKSSGNQSSPCQPQPPSKQFDSMLWFYLCKSSPRNRIVQTALHPAQCACSLPWPSYVANMLWLLLQLACGNEKNEKLAKEERIPAINLKSKKTKCQNPLETWEKILQTSESKTFAVHNAHVGTNPSNIMDWSFIRVGCHGSQRFFSSVRLHQLLKKLHTCMVHTQWPGILSYILAVCPFGFNEDVW